MLLVLALACEPPQPRSPTQPSPYTYEGGATEPAPELTADEVAVGLQHAIDYTARIHPELIHDAWANTMAEHADPDCPLVDLHNGQDHWREEPCVSQDGTTFRGWSLYYRDFPAYDSSIREERQYIEVGWLSGQANILSADGIHLESYGDVLHERWLSVDGSEGHTGFVWGDFRWNDPRAEDTWLQDALTMEMYYSYIDHGSFNSVDMDLSMAFLPEPAPAVIWEALSLVSEPNSCAKEPGGTIQVRDTEGRWYEVEFDTSLATGDACDGCGTVWLNEREHGTACVDWSPLLSVYEDP